MLVLFDNWMSFFRDKVVPWRIGMAEKLREQLEAEVLPRYIESQRWYAAKGERVARAPLYDSVVWDVGGVSWLIAFTEVNHNLYFVPLALGWEEDEDHVRALAATTMARVRQQANVGVLADAVADEAFCRHVVKAVGAARTLKTAQGELRFTPSSAFREIAGDDVAGLAVASMQALSTNTTVTLGDRLFLKVFRRVRPGANPELEVGRFLTERAKFKNCVPLAGAVEYQVGGAEPATLALLQAYLPNQGDGWAYTLAYLERYLAARRSVASPGGAGDLVTDPAVAADVHGAYRSLVQTLAVRTAELHRAFATPSGDPQFEPEPLRADDVQAWKDRVREEVAETFALIERRIGDISGDAQRDLRTVLARRDAVRAKIDAIAAPAGAALKIRHHGDYHLGQVLIANNDFYIIDFEGEPSRPLAESRRKHSPLRDVAGMLRSFNYAKWSARMRITETDPAYGRLAPELETWEQDTREAFLNAYAGAASGSGLYKSFDDVRGLLQLFELEKVLYELRYELNNRPAWVHIPVQGLLSLLGENTP